MKDEIVRKNVAEIPAYSGPHAIPGIRFRAARQHLGVSSWGMNVLEFDADCDGHPEHDHQEDGQEEVYVVLDGSVVLLTPGAEQVLERGDMVRVAPGVKRQLVTRNSGATVLALGATPGSVYKSNL